MLISTNKNGRFRLLVNLMTAKVIFQNLIKSLNVVANFHELTCADFTNQSREYIALFTFALTIKKKTATFLIGREKIGMRWSHFFLKIQSSAV